MNKKMKHPQSDCGGQTPGQGLFFGPVVIVFIVR